MCWDLSQYRRMSSLPGYINLLIKPWANVPGGKNGLCCAKNRESIPEPGTWFHPVHSKTRRLQLQNPLSPAKRGKVELFSGLLRCPFFSRAEAIPGDWPHHPWEVQPSRRHQEFCQFRCQLLCTNESNEETSVCSCLMEKGFLLRCCFHERSSAFPVILDGPKDFTMQGRHLQAFPRKVLRLSFICPEESSAWLLIKI